MKKKRRKNRKDHQCVEYVCLHDVDQRKRVSESMLIYSITVCVYLHVCVRNNMIFAHKSKKSLRRQSKLFVAVKQFNLI